MVNAKSEGHGLELSCEGTGKEIIEDAVQIVIGICESLAKDHPREDAFAVALKAILIKLIKLDLGIDSYSKIMIDQEAAAKQAKERQDKE